MHYFLKADYFIMEDELRQGGYLEVKDGHFGNWRPILPAVEPVIPIIDYGKATIAPGLFDTHIHGVGGADVMDGDTTALHRMAALLPAAGVTRFLPTTLTAGTVELLDCCRKVAELIERPMENAARAEGIFLEGPFFTEKHKGAQNPRYFKAPDYAEVERLQQASGGHIVKVAVAAEYPEAVPFLEKLRQAGIHGALAHTDANFEQADRAMKAGGQIFVHLYNGMSGLHHREPGVVGTYLHSEHAFAELIADGHHVHPAVLAFTAQFKPDRTILITDSMRAGMMPDGEYLLGELAVEVQGGIARTKKDGSLAGSTLQLLDAVKNMVMWTTLDLAAVWRMASLNPARSVGMDGRLGSLRAGKVADFLVLTPDMTLQETWLAGRKIWSAEEKTNANQ
ncbi:N-acetylglucosamine-6-phosphate deacetylase [Listeria costaricensis]|uniref:N-acetylglucosamine-6-phosphate deacetylase n=1 Tax=Listeria costaricensis TaxID=2026604 RepID=UPI000C07D4DB|nr:N-acetylglucosamine-6-phosphate deacetylase [Listeria costaricensis]